MGDHWSTEDFEELEESMSKVSNHQRCAFRYNGNGDFNLGSIISF